VQDEGDNLTVEGVRGGAAVPRVRPGPGDEVTVPAQQRGWRDQEHAPVITPEQPRQRGQHGAISGGVAGPSHLSAQHGQLVTEHRDLDVLLVRRRTEPEEVKEPADEQEGDRTAHAEDLCRAASSLLGPRILSVHPTGS